MEIENKHNIGDIVYLEIDAEENKKMVTAIMLRNNDILYELSGVDDSNWYVSFEIKKEKNYKY